MADQSYFGSPAAGTPTAPGSFLRIANLPSVSVAAGLNLHAFAGDDVMISFARYDPGVEAPLHAHVEEQLLIVLEGEGEFEVEVGDETRILHVGDAAHMPPWVPHRVRAGAEGGYQLDVFSPPRAALLAALG